MRRARRRGEPGLRYRACSEPSQSREAGSSVVGYVGKFIPAKGVHNLLVVPGPRAWARFRVSIVGYGGFEKELRALGCGVACRHDHAQSHRLRRGTAGSMICGRSSSSSKPDVDGPDWTRAKQAEIRWTSRPARSWTVVESAPGILGHRCSLGLAEAFGMVAAEAAAEWRAPVVPRHSGIGEVGRVLEEELGMEGLLTYDPTAPIEGIAGALERVLGADPETRGGGGRRSPSGPRAVVVVGARGGAASRSHGRTLISVHAGLHHGRNREPHDVGPPLCGIHGGLVRNSQSWTKRRRHLVEVHDHLAQSAHRATGVRAVGLPVRPRGRPRLRGQESPFDRSPGGTQRERRRRAQ